MSNWRRFALGESITIASRGKKTSANNREYDDFRAVFHDAPKPSGRDLLARYGRETQVDEQASPEKDSDEVRTSSEQDGPDEDIPV